MGLRNEMKNGADTHFVKGFVVESGVIQPVEAVVKDLVTDCLEVQSDEETLCWHEKFLGLFKDSCLYCNSPCEAYNKEKPVYGKLVSLKRLDDTNQFIQQNIALQKKLYEIYEDIPSTTCTNCGECCGGVGFDVDLSTLEYFHLLEYINKRFSEADLKRFKGLCGMNTALEKRDLKDQVRCVFRDIKNRKCNIYDLRPLVHRIENITSNIGRIEIPYIQIISYEIMGKCSQ